MRKLIISLTVLLALTAQPVPASSPSSELHLYSSSCAQKSYLPAVFFSAFECESCCQAAEAAYQSCRRTKSSTCDCLQAAKDTCIYAGCGPCTCCQDWYIRGVWWQCWE